ncbi:ATP-dependent RNA helicase [Engelhardtia mirabilis]|uniref:ATP-dependent RNA helicase HrpB n=1 Tax=Engelhardtia mirabilis TaxID=2528011 RepID=A0A518BIW5_9BACT|nr:ATP-dependent RNA helicase HrpB [Planctomycetes bacterium Pla133]QDV01248.1 ATP-dependent RNA helicase HrpB [Planctomycetes bacterium Pla86]
MTRTEPLPVDAVLAELVEVLRGGRAAVLRAPTGSGKTTRVPPALLDAGLGPVWLVVPRRIAARAAARRIADERGGRVGEEVGYEVRFDRQVGPRTRLIAMTDGVLLRKLREDPFLEGVGAVVFDEFHERRLATDLGLALARRVRAEVRPELALVVTSATLDPVPLREFLRGADGHPAALVESEGRSFEVRVSHRPVRPDEWLEERVFGALEQVGPAPDGGATLVFLPGRGEIAACARRLEGTPIGRAHTVLELHGDLAAGAQDAVFERSERPKLILATNVAESSITIPDVRRVVDTGLSRTMRHDAGVGVDRLELGRISRASAEQRAGRAGRTGPGEALRLWSPAEERSMAEFEAPEVARLDLSATVLQLIEQGEQDPAAFGWFEAPAPLALERALELLARLGATRAGGLTDLGRALASLPLAPRLGALLIEADRRGLRRHGAVAVALLAERDPFRRLGREERGRVRDAVDSDLLEDVRALEGTTRPDRHLDRGGARQVLRAAAQLERLRWPKVGGKLSRGDDPDEGFLRAVAAAYPDRLARRRRAGEPRALMAGGIGVELGAESRVTDSPFFVCVELLQTRAGPGREPLVARASAFDPEWLDEDRIERRVSVAYDPARDRVVATVERVFGDFVLGADERPVEDIAALEAALVTAAALDVPRALDLADEELTSFAARVACLALWRPELELPLIDEDFWRGLLPDLVPGRRSFADLRRSPRLALASARLTGQQLAALDRDAPERIAVPSGSRLKVNYEPGRAPQLAARIQELFGLRATPRVGGGRVPVVMQLLAPNGRPQQVTDDLESFWAKTYFDVRRELKRRYPKHSWPEDPLNAEAERRPGRRRK